MHRRLVLVRHIIQCRLPDHFALADSGGVLRSGRQRLPGLFLKNSLPLAIRVAADYQSTVSQRDLSDVDERDLCVRVRVRVRKSMRKL